MNDTFVPQPSSTPPGYRVERKLAGTEMSDVYLAREETGLRRRVALKVLKPELAADPAFLERFRREVARAAELEHPHVIPVYRAEVDGHCFLAMRYVSGPTLTGLLEERGRLDLDTTARVLSQLADALDTAHAVGLVHRDVKPGNVLFDRPDARHAYLLDFGIAKEVEVPSSRLTQTGSFLGTAAYAAPEQIEDQQVDGRVDVYALGCVLYECLTGRPPFQGSIASILRSHLDDDPPRVTDVRPDLSADVDELVRKAMAKRPDDRFATCGELADALAALASGRFLKGIDADGTATVRSSGDGDKGGDSGDGEDGSEGVEVGQGLGDDDAEAHDTEGVTAPVARAADLDPTPVICSAHDPLPSPGVLTDPEPTGRRRTARRRLAVAAVTVAGLTAIAVGGAVALTGDEPSAEELTRIPARFRAHCQPLPDGEGFGRASENLVCRDGADGRAVRFGLFDSDSALHAAYAEQMRAAGVERGTGDCAYGTGAEHRYPPVGEAAGRALCFSSKGRTTLLWSDDASRTLAQAEVPSTDDLELVAAWNTWVGVQDYPTRPERELLETVELPRADCRRAPAGTLEGFDEVVAAVECLTDDKRAQRIFYYQFATLDALRRTYRGHVDEANAPSGVYCGDGDAPGFLGDDTYVYIGDVDLGRVLCRTAGEEEFVVEWTTDSLLLLGVAIGSAPDELAAWWEDESGPPVDTIAEALNRQADPPFPTDAEADLLRHIPERSRRHCIRTPEDTIENHAPIPPVAATVCDPGGVVDDLYYYRFDSPAAMDESYQNYAADTDVLCQDVPRDFTGEQSYRLDDEDVGRLTCGTHDNGGYYLAWTDRRFNIVVVADADPDDAGDRETAKALIEWWEDPDLSGPVAP